MVQHVSVTDELVDAYCKAWEQSFTADNPYHTVVMEAEDRKYIEAGLKAALASKPTQQEPPAWWPAVENILKEYGLQAIDFVADFKAALAEQAAQRKPLTEEEIRAIVRKVDEEEGHIIHFARTIEAAHNIKENT